ncbi:MAG TPA: hypothetical protein DHG49_00830 [Clostridiales bacterium]|nr:hypothetical protein [Clostridiales bacterium]
MCINYTTQFCAALPAEGIGKQFFTRKIYKKSNSAIFHGAARRICDNLISNKKIPPENTVLCRQSVFKRLPKGQKTKKKA